MEKLISITFAFLLILNINGFTKGKEKDKDKIKAKDTTEILTSQKLNALSFRLIGPGLTSGRIVDFAVNPKNFSEYFVAVACGGVWKTTNGGITYNSVFDSQESC
jgi:hypothetical protein